MRKSLNQVAAHRVPTAHVVSNIKLLSEGLKTAAAFITSNRDDILSAPVASMKQEVLIATFCTLRRMAAAVNRRLEKVQPLVRELFVTMPAVQRGEPGHSIQSGPFKVTLANKAMNSKEVDQAVVRDVLKSRRIPLKSVMVEIPAPAPVMSLEKLAILVREGKLSEADYNSCFKASAPRMELQVELPEHLDEVIQNRLLGGIRDGK